MAMVGYQLQYPDWRTGDRGIYYNYILGSNGLFIEASNPILSVRVPVAEVSVRGGLAPVSPRVSLIYGSIPKYLFDIALNSFLACPDKEQYFAITADAGYHIYMPPQDGEPGKVNYEVGSSIIMDMHSHGKGHAFFSSQDDKDELGLKLSLVVGKLDKTPVMAVRACVYGYFYQLRWKDVFDGVLTGAVEYEDIEEVIPQDELDCILKNAPPEF